MDDLISRQAAIDALVGITMFKTKHELMQRVNASVQDEQGWLGAVAECLDEIEDLPSAQPEPLSDAYMKSVWTWLLDYQIKAAELKGRYTPCEVLSWVANDWRKEHERSD